MSGSHGLQNGRSAKMRQCDIRSVYRYNHPLSRNIPDARSGAELPSMLPARKSGDVAASGTFFCVSAEARAHPYPDSDPSRTLETVTAGAGGMHATDCDPLTALTNFRHGPESDGARM
jgi:hypothetical protein